MKPSIKASEREETVRFSYVEGAATDKVMVTPTLAN